MRSPHALAPPCRAAARDLPDTIIKDSGDAAWAQAKFHDGKYDGVPFTIQAAATFIRKDWLARLGRKAPENWNELVALAQDFQTEDPGGKSGIAAGAVKG